jgi:hypothetical protein
MHYFSAHGLAVLHLSERKRAPILGARRKGFARKPLGSKLDVRGATDSSDLTDFLLERT